MIKQKPPRCCVDIGNYHPVAPTYLILNVQDVCNSQPRVTYLNRTPDNTLRGLIPGFRNFWHFVWTEILQIGQFLSDLDPGLPPKFRCRGQSGARRPPAAPPAAARQRAGEASMGLNDLKGPVFVRIPIRPCRPLAPFVRIFDQA